MKKEIDYYSLRIKDYELFHKAKIRAAQNMMTLGELTEIALRKYLSEPKMKEKLL